MPAQSEEKYLAECLDIDRDNLNEEYRSVPRAIAYWNEQLAKATQAAAVAKIEFDRQWSHAFCVLRDRNMGIKGGLSLEHIKAKCDADDDLHELALDVAYKDAERVRLRGLVDAVIAKKEMLQSLGAKLRAELHDLTLRENALTG